MATACPCPAYEPSEDDETACECGHSIDDHHRGGSGECEGELPDHPTPPPREAPKPCYQCDAQVTYLFADSRCAKCTRLTPEEVRGDPRLL